MGSLPLMEKRPWPSALPSERSAGANHAPLIERAVRPPSTCQAPVQRTFAVPDSAPSSRPPPHEAMFIPWRLATPFIANVDSVSSGAKGTARLAAGTSNSTSPLALGVSVAAKPSGPLSRTLLTAPLGPTRSEEHTSELQSLAYLVC